MSEIAQPLLDWWDRHGRKDLPWQQSPTAYRVWVSEIMLQQTQVAAVERYYDRFMGSFPTVADLAAADEDTVLHHWSGLGYYSRARNLHKAAGQVMEMHDGEVPQRLDDLIALPGIGRSTAGAILALSAEQRHPILDGNAKRVLARYYAVAGWSGASANLKQLWLHAEDNTPVERVANYTQAIMDLGATLCKRSKPACDRCPLQTGCRARAEGLTGEIPAPKPKKARPRRTAVLLLARHDGAVLLEKRPSNGIWGGLWSFPEFESDVLATAWVEQKLGAQAPGQQEWQPVEHAFSHFDFVMTPLEVTLTKPPSKVADDDRWRWVDPQAPDDLGLAAPIARLLADLALADRTTD